MCLVSNDAEAQDDYSIHIPPLSLPEWEAGVMLQLREFFHVPFLGLEFVSSSMREYMEKHLEALQVNCV